MTTAASTHRTARPARATAVALSATLGLVGVCWVIAIDRMQGMNMGVATRLGSFGSFTGLWAAMMAAMMLPSAVPAIRRVASTREQVSAAPVFVGAYLGTWVLVGVAVYAIYSPHSTDAAGVIAIAAGAYELTPVKRHFRRRCHVQSRSGIAFGAECVGSSIGLMVVMLAFGAMSTGWMVVIAIVVIAQKLMPARAAVDVPLALALVGLGVLVLVSPSSVPGLVPAAMHPAMAGM